MKLYGTLCYFCDTTKILPKNIETLTPQNISNIILYFFAFFLQGSSEFYEDRIKTFMLPHCFLQKMS